MSGVDLAELPRRERIRWLRLHGRHGKLSHDRVAQALGTTRQTVINWEKGAQPKDQYVVKLAQFYDVPEDLLRAPPVERMTLHRLADRLEELEIALDELRGLLPRVGDLQQQLDGLARQVADAAQHTRGGNPPRGSSSSQAAR